MSALCPKCHKDDKTQKLSSVIKEGTWEGNLRGPSGTAVNVNGEWGVGGTYTSVYAQLSTQLATTLQPPQPPEKPSKLIGDLTKFDKTHGKTIQWVLLIGGILSIILGIATISQGVGIYCLGFGAIVAIAAGINISTNKMDEGYAEYQRDVERWKADYAKWQTSIEKWDNCYYCLRDDIVFDPTTNEVLPPEQLKRRLITW